MQVCAEQLHVSTALSPGKKPLCRLEKGPEGSKNRSERFGKLTDIWKNGQIFGKWKNLWKMDKSLPPLPTEQPFCDCLVTALIDLGVCVLVLLY